MKAPEDWRSPRRWRTVWQHAAVAKLLDCASPLAFWRPGALPALIILVHITARMLSVPLPGGGDDLFELWVFRFPTQLMFCFFGRGHEFGRVAGTPRLFD